jgi:UDP-N-acetylglucosamine 2-epimerase (hydrolysing)
LNKKIIFVTGTRADWGKLKSLVVETANQNFEVYLFITGMHNDPKYGNTYLDVQRVKNVIFHRFNNKTDETTMDLTVSKTINGFSKYVEKINPDLIVVHGDRPEPLACAIVGSFKNILVAHVEGGEISGTIDELIRHAISKLSHIHLVSNKMAKDRLVQMGEDKQSIFIIGSPDVDLMFSKNLPTLFEAKQKYDIEYEEYSVCLFHPVTTEINYVMNQIECLTESLVESGKNYIIIYPNNDLGSNIIIENYNKINSEKIKILPSIRFEYFLTILKNSQFIIGNSSAGIREAPYYSIYSINIGTRQNKRDENSRIINVDFNKKNILGAINKTSNKTDIKAIKNYGKGNSSELFVEILNLERFWRTENQKQFQDIN